MIIKIKCKGCGAKQTIKRATIKDARKVKKQYSSGKYICGKCKYRIMAKGVAKELVRNLSWRVG